MSDIELTDTTLVIFDLQQTLLNDFDAHLEAHKVVINEQKPAERDALLDEVIRLWGMSVFDVYRQLFTELSDDKINKLVVERDNLYIKNFTAAAPVLCPGVEAILRYLKDEGLKLAVVSGIRRNLLEIGLTRAGLQQYIAGKVGADDVLHSKPDPESFLKVAAELHVQPDHCLTVGDSFLDMKGAKNAGMRAIGVLTGFTSREKLTEAGAYMVVNDLVELRDLMQR